MNGWVGILCRYSQGTYDVAMFMLHSLDVDVRRKVELRVVKQYHAALLANGVEESAYTWEQCWYSYRFNLWRAFIVLCGMAPSIEHQKKAKKGMFASEPTKADAQLKVMYEKLNAVRHTHRNRDSPHARPHTRVAAHTQPLCSL